MNTIKNTLVENLTTQGQEKLSINGIKDKYIRENMKKLMENQIRQDVGSALNEDFTMGVGAPVGADQGIPHGGDGKAASETGVKDTSSVFWRSGNRLTAGRRGILS